MAELFCDAVPAAGPGEGTQKYGNWASPSPATYASSNLTLKKHHTHPLRTIRVFVTVGNKGRVN